MFDVFKVLSWVGLLRRSSARERRTMRSRGPVWVTVNCTAQLADKYAVKTETENTILSRF